VIAEVRLFRTRVVARGELMRECTHSAGRRGRRGGTLAPCVERALPFSRSQYQVLGTRIPMQSPP
jgi:hypothetical protein